MTHIETYEQGSAVTIEATWESAITNVRLTIRAPDQTEAVLGFGDVVADAPETYHYNVIADQAGDWYYLWEALAPGLGPVEGTFTVDANQTLLDGVTDLSDIRVMIPRVRRALEGPGSTGPLADSAVLTDGQVTALIADAIADIILYTGSAFGHSLLATELDPFYMAPTAWETSEALTLTEQSVVVAQAALGYFFHRLQDVKVSEEISDEASTWKYQLSSTLIRDQMKMLQDARDRALASVGEAQISDSYHSFLAERDALASFFVEPWVDGGVGIGGQVDYRFGC